MNKVTVTKSQMEAIERQREVVEDGDRVNIQEMDNAHSDQITQHIVKFE